jgi:hypothetical protein
MIAIGTTSAIIINPKSDGKGRKVAIGTIAAGSPFNHAPTDVSRKPPNRNKFSIWNGLQPWLQAKKVRQADALWHKVKRQIFMCLDSAVGRATVSVLYSNHG